MIQLLYIEDELADFQLLVRHLRRQGMDANVVRVDDLKGLSDALVAAPWDAVLADYNLPRLKFGEALGLLRERLPECPIILVSSSVGEEAAVELLKEGVWDFVLKDNLARLCPAIERALRDSAQRRARREADARLRQAATVFESTQEGVVITDLETRIVAVNKAFTAITGYSEPEAIGRTTAINRSGRHDRAFYQALWASLHDTGQWQGEIWNRCKAGEIYPAWLTISTVRDEGDRPTHYVGVFSDISQLKRSEEQLAHLAHYDPLTDLPNRLLLQSRLEHALSRAARNGTRAAVLFIDLDRFKTINDSLGHVAGDQLLVDVAWRLRERVRDDDFLGRFGGDEFLLLLEAIDAPEDVALAARDVLAALDAPFSFAGNEIYIGASAGISIFPDDGNSAADLQRAADTAMHQAKAQGHNRFCFYTADMNVNAMTQLELEAALRRALERDELLLHFQPKLDLRSSRIVGAEALLRWQREGLGLVPPAHFIPLAEKTGLIVAIGDWVVDTACKHLRGWRDAGWADLRLSLNVSALQFNASDLVKVVAQALARHQVPANCIELEMTESMLMDDPQQTIETLGELKRTGVKLSLDDFGTGYSSFAYLSRFPIDTLKIDESFVRHIASEPEAAMIAVSIIDLAHRMNLKVVAEGVETEAQLGYLKMRNCDEIQGDLISPAISVDAFTALLNQRKAPGEAGRDAAAPAARRQRTLLLVDGEPAVLTALCELLRPEGYRILTAADGASGLDLLARNAVDVIVSEQDLQGMSGIDFLRRVKAIHPQTVRLVLAALSGPHAVAAAINEGAIYKFLTKPWEEGVLRACIEDAFRCKELADENRRLHREAQAANRELAACNARLRERLAERPGELWEG